MDVGILAIEVHVPAAFVDQKALEEHDGVSGGKYTVGLGQEQMAVCCDREDIIALMKTVVMSLTRKHGIELSRIGRLEVGTESPVDKSKSIKSSLMELFRAHGVGDVEGVDSINACYGGTAALFNTCAWVESSAWDGRLGLVVCGDIAVYEPGPARPAGGAGVVAMLVGPNAPLVLDKLRASHFDDVYDFYKPNPHSEFPVVDGGLSQTCYTRSLDHCWERLCAKYEKAGQSALRPSDFPFMCFHSPYNKLVRKSHSRLYFLDFLKNPDDAKYASASAYRECTPENSMDKFAEITGAFTKLCAADFDRQVGASAMVGRRVGNMYTASLFGALASLISGVDDADIMGKQILMFSYGSGLAASLYTLRVVGSLDTLKQRLDLVRRLDSRTQITPQAFTELMAERVNRHGQCDFSPASPVESVAPGAFYLDRVDDKFRRSYKQRPLEQQNE